MNTRQTTFRNLKTLLALSLVFQLGYGQAEMQRSRGSGEISGKIIDALTQQPIEYANIAILSMADSSVSTGGITNNRGLYNISRVPYGRYILRIDYIGYERLYYSPVILTPTPGTALRINTLELEPKTLSGQEVEVVAEKPMMIQTMDKRIFNVDQSLNAEGQSATEVLQQVPSVDVDMDGGISLRGSENVVVLIDGKPSGLTGTDRSALLDQIPATTIESIEIITNPSAKYDPEGMSGIINVVLKRNRLSGLTGTLSANYAPIYQQGASAQLNYRGNNLNITSLLSYRDRSRIYEGSNYRQSYFNGDTTTLIQESSASRGYGGYTERLQVEYSPMAMHTFSAGILAQQNERLSEEDVDYDNIWPGDSIELYSRDMEETDLSDNLDLSLGYVGKYAGEDHELRIDLQQSARSGDEDALFMERDKIVNNPYPVWRDQQTIESDNHTTSTISMDYSRPLGEDRKLELGYKSILREMDSEFSSESQNSPGAIFVTDSLLALAFDFEESIQAGYGTYGVKLDRFTYQLGLRYEDASTTASLTDSAESFVNKYSSFFPSIHLGYTLAPFNDVYASYSRRVNRPRIRALLPRTNYSDPLNLRTGNPYLLPEYINSYELGYSYFKRGLNVSTAVYWREVENLIQRYKEIDNAGVATTTFRNTGTANSYGAELSVNTTLKKVLRVMVSGNITQTRLEGSIQDAELNSEFFGYNLRSTVSYTPLPGTSIEWFMFFRSPRLVAQGDISSMLFSNLSLKRSFMDNHANVSLQVSDLFNSRKFQYNLDTVDFIQETERRFNNRYVSINLSYRFGNLRDNQSRNGRSPGGSNGFDAGDDMDIGG